MDLESSDARSKILQATLAEISRNNEDSNEDCCVICLERISEKATAQPCKHASFDFLCLVSWLQEQTSCPLCKAEIKTIQYEFKDEACKIYEVPSVKAQPPPFSASSHRGYDHRGFNFRGRRARNGPRREHAPRPTQDDALLRRRHIYRNKLYSLHVGSNRGMSNCP